jgi:hypothetical protein
MTIGEVGVAVSAEVHAEAEIAKPTIAKPNFTRSERSVT